MTFQSFNCDIRAPITCGYAGSYVGAARHLNPSSTGNSCIGQIAHSNHPLWRRLLNGLPMAIRRRQIGPARDQYCQRPQARPRHPPCSFFALSAMVTEQRAVMCDSHSRSLNATAVETLAGNSTSRLQFLLILGIVMIAVGLRME